MIMEKSQMSKLTPVVQYERGSIKLFAKYPANNNFVCSYEVFVENDMFKPDNGRTAFINFVDGQTLEKSYFDYGRFCFFLPKSLQPIFDEMLTKNIVALSVRFCVDGGRPMRDQSEAMFDIAFKDKL
jgi:hypothetical protein